MAERVPLTVRLIDADRAFINAKADEAGLEGGTAARQLVELAIKYMRITGADYIDTLQIVKNALKPRFKAAHDEANPNRNAPG